MISTLYRRLLTTGKVVLCGLFLSLFAQAASPPTILTNNAALSGLSGGPGDQTFYQITVPTNRSRLIFRVSGATPGCYLFVKQGSEPTFADFVPFPASAWPTFTAQFVVTAPIPGDYFIMLYGYWNQLLTNYSDLTLWANYDALPDLTYASPTTLDQVPKAPGDKLAITLSVTNAGDLASVPAKVSYYFRTDANNHDDRVMIGQIDLPMVKATSSVSGLKFTYTLPMTTLAGAYHVFFWLDKEGKMAESNVGNNIGGWTNDIVISGPSVQVTSPRPGQRLADPICTVTGTAPTNKLVTNVLYQLNPLVGASWSNATGTNNWSSWSAQVTLVPGTNVFQVEAADIVGNYGAMTNLSFIYSVTNRLVLLTNGVGTITRSGFSGDSLEQGLNYSVTAVPGTMSLPDLTTAVMEYSELPSASETLAVKSVSAFQVA